MEISHANFPQELITIIEQIASCHLVAFDLEFSGVAARRSGSGKLSLQEYYHDLRSAAQTYQILQVGLTVVTEDVSEGRYVCRPYNIHLSPLPATKENVFRRVWSYDSGAISFLMRNGFNVDRPLQQGVQYLSRQEEDQVRQKMIDDEESRAKIPDMTLRDDDSALVNHIKDAIKEWQALPKDKQESYLNIPKEGAQSPIPETLNRYQVRLTHQIVRNEYPNLKTQGMGHFVQVTNPTSEQQANEKELQEQRRELKVANAIGFRWVIEAMLGGDISRLPHYYVTAGSPAEKALENVQPFLDDLQGKLKRGTRALVGHNCLTDLINLYRCFIGDLPETLEEFSARLQEHFPRILDTKYIASLGGRRWADTSLGTVESELSAVRLPQTHVPNGFDRYLYASNYHEAGYDSFATAMIALKMTGKLKREGDQPGESGSHGSRTEGGGMSSIEKASKEQPPIQSGESQRESASFAQSVVDAITAPVTTVKTLISGAAAEGTVSQEKRTTSTDLPIMGSKPSEASPSSPPKEAEKVKSISRKTNIYDLLEDEPEDVAGKPEDQQKETNKRRHVSQMVQRGELLPRWEDADFWDPISNKLQANACQEGVVDLLKPAEGGEHSG